MAFLPALFSPALMLIGERAVYQFMSWLAPDDYMGGLWHFHERDGRPLFLSPDADKRFRIFCVRCRTPWKACRSSCPSCSAIRPTRSSRRSTDIGLA